MARSEAKGSKGRVTARRSHSLNLSLSPHVVWALSPTVFTAFIATIFTFSSVENSWFPTPRTQ